MSDQSGSWQPDPFGRHQYRYWDGSSWSDQVSNDGVVSSDPATAEGAAGAAADATPSEPDPTEATPGWGAPPPDATTSMPAAPGADPFPPPAFAATAPAATPSSSSGNKLPLILGGVALLALIGVGAFLLLGGDDDDGPSRAELISDFQDEADLSEEQATCVVDALEDSIGLDRVGELADDPDDASDADRAALAGAITGCAGADEETTDTTEDDTTDTTTGDIDLDDPLMEAFIAGIMSESDLTQEQARCFGEEFLAIDGIDMQELANDPNSILTDPEIMSAMFAIFSTCDIDPSTMGGGSGGASGLQEGDTYGDNPELDALWDACEGGDGEACDDLYFSSPIGSEYEEFGDTCGGRFEAGTVLCATEDLG